MVNILASANGIQQFIDDKQDDASSQNEVTSSSSNAGSLEDLDKISGQSGLSTDRDESKILLKHAVKPKPMGSNLNMLELNN